MHGSMRTLGREACSHLFSLSVLGAALHSRCRFAASCGPLNCFTAAFTMTRGPCPAPHQTEMHGVRGSPSSSSSWGLATTGPPCAGAGAGTVR